MSQIDQVKELVRSADLFYHESGPTYVRLLDTPHIWGERFGPGIMDTARERTKEFEGAIIEVISKTKYRCDLASLNSPDPAWTKVVLEAMDMALSTRMNRAAPTQFRFLFGQTPMMIKTGTPPNYIDFQGNLIRLVRERSKFWETMPEIWTGRFFRIQEGVMSAIGLYLKESFKSATPSVLWGEEGEDKASTKMTWNHSKIIASDGAEALVGGHNLNMDLFINYPPVHDASVVVHGAAALGSQLFLNEMWERKSDLLVKEYLTGDLAFRELKDDNVARHLRRPADPLTENGAKAHMAARYKRLAEVHGGTHAKEPEAPTGKAPVKGKAPEKLNELAKAIVADDLQTLRDLEKPLYDEGEYNDTYAKRSAYKKATRVLSVGKYWVGSNGEGDFKEASELMKYQLISRAQHTLHLSQMDLISAWKKMWQSHVVCHWILDALRLNTNLVVRVVVSPLDAGAGAEGDQYSFGSGAVRTYDLFEYYSTHNLDDTLLNGDALKTSIHALSRLHIAPFYFTDQGTDGHTIEGGESYEKGGYKWPELPEKGKTQTIKQPSLKKRPPKKGVIGDAVESGKMGSGMYKKYGKVESAPGNHAKIMIVDNEAYVVGSDNLYPGFLSEFNFLVEGQAAVGEMLTSYWDPLWWYSGQHCVNPLCQGKAGCTAKGKEYKPAVKSKVDAPAPVQNIRGNLHVPLSHPANVGKVQPIVFEALWEQGIERAPNLPVKAEKDSSQKDSSQKDSSQKDSSQKELSPQDESVPQPSKKVESDEVSPDERRKRELASKGQGVFLPVNQLPDLTAPGYYFTEDDIYNLQRFKLQAYPNIAVIPGVIYFQWEEMNIFAYATETHPAITADTDTIVQPFHVGGNHWALLYIMLGDPVKLLYIDPLNPNAVPVHRLGLLRRPFPGIQAEHALVRYQNDQSFFGQNSCGAWVVYLAEQLALRDGRLPNPDANPHQAALDLRVRMNLELPAAWNHALPVAPGNRGRWARPSVRDDSALPVLSQPGKPALKRSGSLGEMMRQKKIDL